MDDPKYDVEALIHADYAEQIRAAHEGAVIVRCVIVSEYISADGGTGVRMIRSNGCQAWQAVGLLHTAMAMNETDLLDSEDD
jgi:hypothetical protein